MPDITVMARICQKRKLYWKRRKQYNTIPPTVEYSLAERGRTLIPALESVYQWADEQMKKEEQ